MLTTVAFTLVSLLTAAFLFASGQGQVAAVAHVAFAIGIVPLIFAAMIHFVPVLTRTGEPSPWIRRLPALAQGVGVLIVLAMQGVLPYHTVYAGAVFDFFLTASLFLWLLQRAGKTLGRPHPGWRWYAGALSVFLCALLAVLAMPFWPGEWAAWRVLHLHLNTLGLLGLAAFGTLPVLLPTALGQADPQAAPWLLRKFWPMLAGVVLCGLGAAFYAPLAVLGSVVLLFVTLSLPQHWWRQFGAARLQDGVALGLFAAVSGFALSLFAGNLHALLAWPARPAIAAWAALFLLPLVTAALSQLLPVWRWPGPKVPGRAAMRALLVQGAAWRAGGFLLGGMAFLLEFSALGVVFSCAALLSFIVQLLRALRVERDTEQNTEQNTAQEIARN